MKIHDNIMKASENTYKPEFEFNGFNIKVLVIHKDASVVF